MGEPFYTISVAKPSDAKDIVDFFNARGAETNFMSFGFNEYRFTAEQEKENLIKMEKEKNEVKLVVRDNLTGQMLAGGSTYTKGRRSKHVFGLGLVVRKQNWRQGIGRAMMERFEVEARKLGAEKMYLDTNGENEGAVKLYESLGYEVEGRLKKELKIEERYVDLILMGKHLD